MVVLVCDLCHLRKNLIDFDILLLISVWMGTCYWALYIHDIHLISQVSDITWQHILWCFKMLCVLIVSMIWFLYSGSNLCASFDRLYQVLIMESLLLNRRKYYHVIGLEGGTFLTRSLKSGVFLYINTRLIFDIWACFCYIEFLNIEYLYRGETNWYWSVEIS